MTTQIMRLSDYQTPGFDILHCELDFDLHETHTRVISRLQIKKLKDEPLILNGENLKLISILMNQEKVDYELTKDKLKINRVPAEFTLEIVTEVNPTTNTSLDGLYLSKGLLTTQCEAQGFRKITYFLDRPDVMTKFTVTLTADKKKFPILLSNGDLVESKDLGLDRHTTKWVDPFKKPSYLFALVAGDMGVLKDSYKTMSGKVVSLEIYGPHGQESKCEHAMQSLKKAMQWDEEKFGREYDLSTYMIVAIEDFNMGAMENKGLNIFNASLIFADLKTSTDDDFLDIESVVAHEYFHNWTGNRITCRDWFHLSLKEGLTVYRDQEFSCDLQGRDVERITAVDALRSRQFLEDAGPNSHPVRPDEGASMDNFYSATIYEKGAEVIRMMKNWMGTETFRKAMDLYFQKYDGQAVTIEEFTSCLAEISGKDLTHFKLWYHQSGTPEIRVEESFDNKAKIYSLRLTQKTEPTQNQPQKKPLQIPFYFSLIDSSGSTLKIQNSEIKKNSDGKDILLLSQESQTFQFTNLSEKPSLSFNQEFSAPVNLKWKPSTKDLLTVLKFSQDGFSRREAIYSLYYQALDQMVLENKTEVSPEYIEAIKSLILDSTLSYSLKAVLLNFPSSNLCLQRYEKVALNKIENARNQIEETLASELKYFWRNLYLQLPSTVGVSAEEVGIRELESISLSLWSLSQEATATALVSEKSYLSPFMSTRLNNLQLLIDRNLQFKQESLDLFVKDFENNSLVMNKWFKIQALSTHTSTFEVVQKLVHHPLFDIKNPNKVYSLVRYFGANAFRFYDLNSDSLIWYAEMIKKVDSLNPQVAARLCAAYDFVPKLPDDVQSKVQFSLERLKSAELSKNVSELIAKI